MTFSSYPLADYAVSQSKA